MIKHPYLLPVQPPNQEAVIMECAKESTDKPVGENPT